MLSETDEQLQSKPVAESSEGRGILFVVSSPSGGGKGTLIQRVLNKVSNLSYISAGRDIILEVDVQGAASVRALMADSVSIFILPPSFEVLRQRLQARGTDSPEELDLRLRNAPTELKDYSAFQYVIINDDVDRAADQLTAIIQAERARLSRQGPRVKRVVEAFTASDRSQPATNQNVDVVGNSN